MKGRKCVNLPRNQNMRLISSNPIHINLACWNVLADSYACSQTFKSTTETLIPKFIEWDNRKHKIASSLADCGADILCLQEVDHYTDFFEPLLEKLGFKSLYLQRHRRKDGCLIAFNNEKFQVHGVEEVQFDDIANFMENESAKTNVKRSNVGLIALMSSRKDPTKQFISSTAHIYWNPRKPEVKSYQTRYLVSRIDNFISVGGLSAEIPVFIAGDFNSVPFSEPYQLLINGFVKEPLKKGAIGLKHVGASVLYGPKTKFLCDRNLSRLCRWMRVLGIDTALAPEIKSNIVVESTAISGDKSKLSRQHKANKQLYDIIFDRARKEERVILTTSKGMRERSNCPPSFLVSPQDLERALIEVCKEYGLSIKQDKFLTVCGKCGGEIEECSHSDPRVSKNSAVPPIDRDVFICKQCYQPYWWNERETSTPARAMKMADKLYHAIQEGTKDQSEILGGQVTDNEVSINGQDEVLTADGTNSLRPSPSPSTIDDRTADLTALFTLRSEEIASRTLKLIPHTVGDASSVSTLSTVSGVTDVSEDSLLLEGLSISEEISPVNLLIAAECVLEETMTRRFNSAYASVHGGEEPSVTNWSHDFKDTLDYVFMSDEWTVESAHVVPNASLSAEADEDIKVPMQKGVNSIVENAQVDFFAQEVRTSQPTDDWPSDHFMVLVKASF